MACPHCGAGGYDDSSGCSFCGFPSDDSTSSRGAVGSTYSPTTDPPLVSSSSSSEDSDVSARLHRRRSALTDAFAPGDELDTRYTIIDFLGRGGMGAVYKAHDRALDRRVALKVIRDEVEERPEASLRFRRELALAQSVSHRNVCRVHDLGEAAGRLFLSMEFLDGHTLDDLICEVGRLSVRQTWDIAEQICSGLEAIHAQGIVHRDLKPSNIGITPSGRVAIMDFGIARRHIDAEVTEPGKTVGTFGYLAPEQIRGRSIDARCDLYALGLVLFEMLTGRRPPADDDPRPLAFRDEGTRVPPPSSIEPGIPHELDDIILRCLAWDPANRPQSVESVATALRACRTSSESASIAPRRTARWSARLIVASVVIVAGVVFMVGNRRPVSPPVVESIAVLPFDYTGTDTAHEGIGVRMSDLLSLSLETIPSLSVAPHDTVRELSLDRESTSLGQLAEDLGVSKLVRGSVGLDEESLLISVALLERNGAVLWQSSVSGPLLLPQQAVHQVGAGLSQQLGVAVPTLPRAARSPSAQAHDTYLEARMHHERWDVPEDLERAVTLYRDAIAIDPEFAAARAALARSLVTQFYQSEDPALIASAREQLALASAVNPDLPEVLVARGYVGEVTGDTAEAEEAFRRAIERTPGNDTAHRGLGHLMADLGRHDEARSVFERAVSLRPGSWRNHYALGRYLMTYLDDVENAVPHLERAYGLHREGVGPKVYLGLIHLTSGRLDEAERWYRRILEERPSSWAQYNLGVVQYYRSNFELALQNFQAALDGQPEYPLFMTAVGHALYRLGAVGQSQEIFRRALERYRELVAEQPDEYEKRAQLGSLLGTMGQCEEARSEIDGVLQRNPESGDFLAKATQIEADCGDQDAAVRYALRTLATGNLAPVRFDPAVAIVREDLLVQQALAAAGLAVN